MVTGQVQPCTACIIMYTTEFLVALLSVCSASAHLCYVLPNNSSPLSCPGQPCLTMEQYIQLAGTYIISGSTFTFLSGNHSLESVVNLANISDLTLSGEGSGTLLIIRSNTVFLLDAASNVTIKELTFSLHSSSSTSMVLSSHQAVTSRSFSAYFKDMDISTMAQW